MVGFEDYLGDNGEPIEEKENTDRDERVAEQEEVGLEETEEVTAMSAYVIIDKEVHGLLDYFRGHGVNVSNIYTNIKDALNKILIQSGHCRIIVVDTGTGRFSNTKIRQELTDMIGICDEYNRVTVFYTDSVIMVDSMRKIGRGKIKVDWLRYNGTLDIVLNILRYGEKYELESGSDIVENTDTDLTNVRGLPCLAELGDMLELKELTHEEIKKGMENSEQETIKGYDIVI